MKGATGPGAAPLDPPRLGLERGAWGQPSGPEAPVAWLLSGALLPPAVLPATAQASPSGSPPCPLQAFSRSHPTVRHPAGSRPLRSVPPLPFPRQPAGAERSLVGGIRRLRLEPQPCGSPQNKAGTSGPPAIWASICKRRDPRNDLHAGGSRENLGRTHK